MVLPSPCRLGVCPYSLSKCPLWGRHCMQCMQTVYVYSSGVCLYEDERCLGVVDVHPSFRKLLVFPVCFAGFCGRHLSRSLRRLWSLRLVGGGLLQPRRRRARTPTISQRPRALRRDLACPSGKTGASTKAEKEIFFL